MKRFQFLLLDAGPIIKLFELGIWEAFLNTCDVAVARTVAEHEVVFAATDFGKDFLEFGLASWEEKGLISIVDVDVPIVKAFHNRFDAAYREMIHAGEEETLAFVCGSHKQWLVCAADGAVFRVLGLLGRGDQGISLEEVLQAVGLAKRLEYQFTKRFRERYTRLGASDSIQGTGLNRSDRDNRPGR